MHIQLNRVLPPGPKQYWEELAVEHRNAPEHQKWMYEADPFAARKEVDQRQAQVISKRRDEANVQRPAAESVEATLRGSEPRRPVASGEFAQAPEVRMAASLRELAEDAIKQVTLLFCILIRLLTLNSRPFLFIRKQPTSPRLFCLMKTLPRSNSNSGSWVSPLCNRAMP
jgi:hypothetical protein